jgi:hypothetical protein
MEKGSRSQEKTLPGDKEGSQGKRGLMKVGRSQTPKKVLPGHSSIKNRLFGWKDTKK